MLDDTRNKKYNSDLIHTASAQDQPLNVKQIKNIHLHSKLHKKERRSRSNSAQGVRKQVFLRKRQSDLLQTSPVAKSLKSDRIRMENNYSSYKDGSQNSRKQSRIHSEEKQEGSSAQAVYNHLMIQSAKMRSNSNNKSRNSNKGPSKTPTGQPVRLSQVIEE